jgi:hypothetical protein
MKKILIAALLLAGTAGAHAQPLQPADWVTLSFSASVNKPADLAWQRIGGNEWCGIAKYLDVKNCVINSGKGELGSIRTIDTGTATVVENVVARTPLSYTYAQPLAPAVFYHGTLAVEPVDATHSRIVYSLIWNQNGLPDAAARKAAVDGRKVRFQAAVDKMAAAANAP